MRKLSYYQRAQFLTKIRKLRKWNPGNGEENPHHKFDGRAVRSIRSAHFLTRKMAAAWAIRYGTHKDYPYQLRQKNENGEWKKWPHLK